MDFQSFEKKWSAEWKETGLYEPDFSAPPDKKFYNLMMFPYPSAEGLHVGNMYAFTGTDVYGRFKRMQGYDVFEPIGLDGFGIHSENYALKIGAHPMQQSKISEERFYKQLEMVGNSYAWKEKLETYDPAYYRWTQWIFLQMWKRGLAYRKKQEVNWCPSCLTVLADEQVEQGKCERCGTEVIKKDLEQWFFRITKYAEKLLQNLDAIDWTEKVKIAQRNWIGKSEGARIKFPISNFQYPIEVFTTRPDTLFGVTYVVLAPEHELLANSELQIANKEEVQNYIAAAKKKTSEERIANKEKSGVELKGIKAINPANKEEISVFVADYVLGGYGTGAIMAVPAHDQRDWDFADAHVIQKLPVVMDKDQQIGFGNKQPGPVPSKNHPDYKTAISIISDELVRLSPKVDEGILINSGDFDGLSSEEAKLKITEFVGGKMETQYRLRDWLISRQRYWGAPIPMVFCDACAKEGKGEHTDMPGWYPVPENQLPVVLPYVEDFRPRGTGVSPLASVEEFYKTTCPACGGEARRETDVSDTFLDSAWYYIGYIMSAFDWKLEIGNLKLQEVLCSWLPVDMYIGGAEHSVLHLLYVRFVAMVLHDAGVLGFEEPFPKFRAHGLLIKEGAKISKSKGNIINPDQYIREFGADAFRMYLMFLAPFEQGGDFRDEGILGVERFLKRVWKFADLEVQLRSGEVELRELQKLLHKTIKKVTDDIESLKFNTAVSALMILFNEIERSDAPLKIRGESGVMIFEPFLKLLAPFAPFMTEEIWREKLGHKTSIHKELWPVADEARLKDEVVTIAVQIGGKTRGTVQMAAGSGQDIVAAAAHADAKLAKHLEGKEIKKVIFVQDKIINFIT